jgi:5-formyltetrahydrofolate cyclo-ligase
MQPSAERVADLQAEKQALRQQLARVRELLDPKQATAWSEAIGQQLLASKLLTMFSSDQLDPATPIIKKTPEIGLFNAMRQEVDFQPVWQTLRSRGFRLCFPRMIRSEGRTDLEFLAMPDQLDPASLLVQSHFGVREPAAATPPERSGDL